MDRRTNNGVASAASSTAAFMRDFIQRSILSFDAQITALEVRQQGAPLPERVKNWGKLKRMRQARSMLHVELARWPAPRPSLHLVGGRAA